VFSFNPWALPGILSGLAALAMAVLVYRARPDLDQNRYLACWLAIVGFYAFTVMGIRFFSTDPTVARALWLAGTSFWWFHFLFPVLFLSTLRSRFARPVRSRAVRSLLILLVVVPTVWGLIRSELWGSGMLWVAPLSVYAAHFGPMIHAVQIAALVVPLYGLAVVLTVRPAGDDSLERRRNRILLAAFAVAVSLLWLFSTATVLFPIAAHPDRLYAALVNFYVLPFIAFALVLMLGYGVLSTQLLNIELHLKWGIQNSTIAGAFVVVFFVVTETARELVSEVYGPYFGIAAVAMLLLAASPLRRTARFVTDRLLPHVQRTPAYLEARRIEIYRASVLNLMADGTITAKERRALLQLHEDLAIPAETANRLELEILETLTARPGA
jgi:hypothetical protein